jgi:deazaflavin-dependent oxidoreductase (nitroreductase family)
MENLSTRLSRRLDMNRFYPAGPLGRVAFKAPLTLWRMGLGRLLGGVMVVITHTGRKSGLPRRTMTEYQRDGETIYVPVAFGDRAQWYQNIAADPRVTLQTDRGARSMLAHRVTGDEELGRVYDLIKARNPLMFSAYLKSIGVEESREGIIAGKDRVTFLAFEPTLDSTPPPLLADLIWLWPVLLVVLVILILVFNEE